MTDHLTFECPHCRKPVDVKEERLGGNIDCPHCDHTFQARAPMGRLLSGGQDSGAASGVEEQTLRVVRPVLFRQHLLMTTIASVLLIVSLVGLVLCLLGKSLLGMQGAVLLTVSLLAGLIALGYGIARSLDTLGTTLTITTSRSILRKGILSANTSEVQHDDIRNIKADRNAIERLLNYGDIAISSSGQDDFEIVVRNIPDPEGALQLIRQNQSHAH